MKSKKLFNRNFVLVLVGQIISLFGNGIIRFALPLYLLRETNSSALFGIVMACSCLPIIVLSFFGGVLADRVDKRNIMVGLDFLTAIIIGIVTVVLGQLPLVPLIIVTLMLLFGISGTYQPAVLASIALLVEEKDVLSAGAAVNQVGALAALLGPTVGGILFAQFGIMPILYIGMGCFFASAVMELFIHIPHTKRESKIGAWSMIKQDFLESSNYMRREKPLLIGIIGVVCVFNLVLSSMVMVGVPVILAEILKVSDTLIGYSQGALALGGLVGGVLVGVLKDKCRLSNSHWLLLGASVSVGAMAVPILLHGPSMVIYAVITGGSFLIMVFGTIFTIQTMATVQIETPPQLVGKVIALLISFATAAQPLGQLIYGFAFEQFQQDIGYVLLCTASLSVIISICAKKVLKS